MIYYKFSIITPEHDPGNIPFLNELYDSILEQTYGNWEWVILTNGKCTPQHLPERIRKDFRVKIFHHESITCSIGKLKNDAFNLGTGDILVEVDHDDMITPDCLQELNEAYQDQTVGFVYSDDAMYHMLDQFVPYNEDNGWTYRMFNYKGKELYAMNSFEPTSHALSYIWFAPDHVRSWRKSVYKEIGGHNPELEICDDHELCIRTYLKTKMVRIPKVLYIYRITGVNTSMNTRNADIQVKTVELNRQYARALAERDADLNGLLKVDIGGGLNPYPGYKTIDMRDTADMKADLNEGIPLIDGSVGVLNASHILEHLHDKTKIMSEIHRVLAPGGWAFIDVPSTDGRGAFQDPTHVSYWNENSFLYYTDANLGNFIDNTNIRFQEYRRDTYFPNEWMKSINVSVTTAWLVAVKPESPRYPGILKI
jgi:glycosyltransferase involved in cell wall biosynthesis